MTVPIARSGKSQPGDRRVRRTRATMERALVSLVGEQALSQIGVTDVVDRADVSRSTFYDHYRDVHELAEAACTSMIDDLIDHLVALRPPDGSPVDSVASPGDPDPALTGLFAHFAEHASLYRSLLGPTGSARVIEHVRRCMAAAAHYSRRLGTGRDSAVPNAVDLADLPHDVPAAFVAGALLSVATDWLRRGCPRTPIEMTVLTKPLMSALSVHELDRSVDSAGGTNSRPSSPAEGVIQEEPWKTTSTS